MRGLCRNRNNDKRSWRNVYRIIIALSLCLAMAGCGFGARGKDGERQEIAYTVCSDREIPDELRDIIEEKKVGSFKLSYVNNDAMYIAVGYGEHNRQNLRVTVEDIFMTSKGIFVETNLYTEDELMEEAGQPSMYPYIVIRCEKSELPIIFDVD